MRILVTGASGQVATALAEGARLRREIDLLALGRPALDLERPIETEAAIIAARPDLVVNAAAYTTVDKAESEPERAFAINRDGAAAVARATATLAIPLIHLSTDYVFDGAKPTPYVETDPTNPLSVYGRSKRDGEESVRATHPASLILRTSWVFSATGQNFVRTMLRLAETRSEISVVADQIGRPTPADDLAEAVLGVAANLLAERAEPALRGIFHVGGTGDAISWAGLAEAIFAERVRRGGSAVGVRTIGTADYPTPARRPANSRLSTGRITRDYGISPRPWRDAVKDVVAELSRT